MIEKPHIILIITDQQRADTIAALGAPWMNTPNLDRLAREGTAFANCFVTSPVCVGSRASLFSGQFPHGMGVFKNFQPWEPTWVRSLADAGYHCASIGKMHINPYDALGGFHQRYVVENKDRPLFLEEHDRAFHDEWDKALHARGIIKPTRYTRYAEDPQGFQEALGCYSWELDEDMHSDNFVGDTALWWLEERKADTPLFLEIGFPGPHPPYDPTPGHLAAYDGVSIPVPTVTEAELAAQPRSQAEYRRNMITFNIDSLAWRENLSAEELLRLRRHYAANVSMIDEKVGQIMDVLDSNGYLDDAVVIFTSDHADALGDHGHIQKWTMYDTVERVPLIVWGPGRVPAGNTVHDLVQLSDVAPTILELASVGIPESFDTRSLLPICTEELPGRDVVYAELARDHIQSGAEFIIMRRDAEWKLVWYLDEPDGELYHLTDDPEEVVNLWTVREYDEKREELLRDLQEWAIRGMLQTRMGTSCNPQTPMPTD
tara:strand:- start:4929 stop:6392 length:1464 start_codon:yes stop_codon:yes gene_type:complete